MVKIDHLTTEQLAGVLRNSVPDAAWVEHLRTCPDCRGELASSLLIGGLMRSERSTDGADHLSSPRIREAHAAAFEFDELKSTQFIAALRHMNGCDLCYAKFFALHESLTPSDRAVSGAIGRFAQGQSKRKAGTLRITRSLERLAQAFVPFSPPEGPVGVPRRRSSAAPQLMPGRPEDVAHGRVSAKVAMWVPDASAPEMLESKSVGEFSRASVRKLSPDDAWNSLGIHAQTAAQELEEIVGQIQNLRKEARSAEQGRDDERLELTLDELNRLQDRFAIVTAPLEEVRVQFQRVLDELHERLVEMRRRNQETYESDPEIIVLPGLALLVVSKWTGRSGSLEISAVDPETHEPRQEVEITPVVKKGALLPSIKTDTQGRAVVPLEQQILGLEIVVDRTDKPWVIDIALSNRPPRF